MQHKPYFHNVLWSGAIHRLPVWFKAWQCWLFLSIYVDWCLTLSTQELQCRGWISLISNLFVFVYFSKFRAKYEGELFAARQYLPFCYTILNMVEQVGLWRCPSHGRKAAETQLLHWDQWPGNFRLYFGSR